MRFPTVILLLFVSTSMFAADPDPANYDKYLIPLSTGSTPGAGGSIWTTTLMVHNRRDAALTVLASACDDFHPGSPTFCWDSTIPPHASEQGYSFARDEHGTPGAFLYVPRDANYERTPMTLRVRDISLNAQSFGTEVPTPNVTDFLQQVILTDVPTDPGYRATLRIYSASEAPREVVVRIYTLTGQTPIEERRIELLGTPILVVDPFAFFPAYGVLDPLSAAVRAAGPSVRIEIEDPLRHIVSPPPPPIWAMVSVTNNATQQVTIVDP